MTEFTPVAALAGGVLIGAAASLLLWATGRIAGISGIVAGLLRPLPGDVRWRLWFVAGLLLAGAGARWFSPAALPGPVAPASLLLFAGVLVGAGTRLSGGCTSGHGVCGISRGSSRSIAATATFMLTGFVTVFVTRHWLGAP